VYLILISLFVFILFYVLLLFLFKDFITNKIKPIYKIIHKIKDSSYLSNEKLESGDIISAVEKEVKEWEHLKTKEIDSLKANEKYRKEFLGNVSHELKTPIFNIQGYIFTLLDGGLEDKSINRKYLERAEKSVNRLVNIVEDLVTISFIESDEIKLKFERFNLISVIEEIFEMQEVRASEKNISLKFSNKLTKPVSVFADKKGIFELISNLIINSIKYGNTNGNTEIEIFDMDKVVVVEVKDDGIGIAEKYHHRIFERFFRIEKSRSRNEGGTGLGLAIVKHIIEAHNQTISMNSAVNQGTSFTFTLQKAI
jgi:two-component system phosphate regulon sensor histidine kinase PhoR